MNRFKNFDFIILRSWNESLMENKTVIFSDTRDDDQSNVGYASLKEISEAKFNLKRNLNGFSFKKARRIRRVHQNTRYGQHDITIKSGFFFLFDI